ncbi:uncharacterized protein LOC128852560 [Cuculus canorus]|uniref:uncharacterized protein LOC128852560 n=1 Tax=Cuculus canorus TaxID=55661 RepID=UPI0023AB0CC2|nr:uncharacterized protein LOC128852560 [Cuculus canorus]
MEGSGAQVLFSSIPTLRSEEQEVREKHLINAWLRAWCEPSPQKAPSVAVLQGQLFPSSAPGASCPPPSAQQLSPRPARGRSGRRSHRLHLRAAAATALCGGPTRTALPRSARSGVTERGEGRTPEPALGTLRRPRRRSPGLDSGLPRTDGLRLCEPGRLRTRTGLKPRRAPAGSALERASIASSSIPVARGLSVCGRKSEEPTRRQLRDGSLSQIAQPGGRG